MVSQIQYPYALSNKDSQPVHVDSGVAGRKYTCLGCDGPMLYRQGKSMRSHFAHRISTNSCSPSDAHRVMSKYVVCEAVSEAIAGQIPYEIMQTCENCEAPLMSAVLSFNVNLHAVVDYSVAPGLSVSVAIVENNLARAGLDIVSEMPVSAVIEEKYQSGNMTTPVYIHEFEFSKKDELQHKFIAGAVVNALKLKCSNCAMEESPAEPDIEEYSTSSPVILEETEVPLVSVADPDVSPIEQKLPFRPWVKDARGRLIRARIRERIYASALLLTQIGFRQSTRCDRPYVFSFREAGQILFANFSAPYQPPVWVDPSALLHGASDNRIEDNHPELFVDIIKRCRGAGAEVAIPSKYQHLDPSSGDVPHPKTRVDSRVLSVLCAAGNEAYASEMHDPS